MIDNKNFPDKHYINFINLIFSFCFTTISYKSTIMRFDTGAEITVIESDQ